MNINDLTPWVLTTKNPPPFIGWWKTRRSDNPGLMQPQRRWWNGEKWSFPVMPDSDDANAEALATMKARVDINLSIEWCGLQSKPTGPYPYDLTQTPRSQLLHKATHHDTPRVRASLSAAA